MFKSPGDGLPLLDGQIRLVVRSAACWALLLGSSVVASSMTMGSSSSSEVSRQITLPSAGIFARAAGQDPGIWRSRPDIALAHLSQGAGSVVMCL